jgi:hypothetical protein
VPREIACLKATWYQEEFQQRDNEEERGAGKKCGIYCGKNQD